METTCDNCKSTYRTLPSWYKRSNKHFCGKKCSGQYHKEANAELLRKAGKDYRFKPGHKPSINRKMQKGTEHYAWKGDKVGYRGLHYWLRRVKGSPEKCTKCGSIENLQWANTDGLYKRDVEDFIALCPSCHKIHDLAL